MKRAPVFALIDCNNFFVSCERLFRPDLEDKPVVVLSSNDGCAVSRSAEAKLLGIPMGAPAFKYRQIFERHQVAKFSANFELYGNISRRITALLTSITPNIEIYSIDESFLDLSSLPITDYEAWGKAIRQHILDWVGIPVSVGIAPTKTLAKLANLQAKKRLELGGVLALDNNNIDFNLKATAVSDIWGIGWRLTPRLRAEGLSTAQHIAALTPKRAGQLMGVHGRQLVAELNGTSCHGLELEGRLPQSIAATRTFGEDTSDIYAIEAALATFVATASYKLRRSGQLTRQISLFATTNRHKPGYRSWYRQIQLPQPTADPGVLLQAIRSSLDEFYKPQISYHRAGITLYDFAPDSQLQTDLLGGVDVQQHSKSKERMAAFDTINNRYGRRSIRMAAELLGNQWKPKYLLRSPRYVSRWDELPRLKAMGE